MSAVMNYGTISSTVFTISHNKLHGTAASYHHEGLSNILPVLCLEI